MRNLLIFWQIFEISPEWPTPYISCTLSRSVFSPPLLHATSAGVWLQCAVIWSLFHNFSNITHETRSTHHHESHLWLLWPSLLTWSLLSKTGSVLSVDFLAASQNCFWEAYLFMGQILNRQSLNFLGMLVRSPDSGQTTHRSSTRLERKKYKMRGIFRLVLVAFPFCVRKCDKRRMPEERKYFYPKSMFPATFVLMSPFPPKQCQPSLAPGKRSNELLYQIWRPIILL